MSETKLLGNVRRFEVSFVGGRGCWLEDAEGKRYLDMLGGIAVCALGHDHPDLTAALREHAGLLHVSNLFYTPQAVEAAEALVRRIGPGRVYFCNSGTEANEAAIKAVRKLAWRRGEPGRAEIVALEGSFHGRTMGSLAATIQPAKWTGFGPLPGGFRSVRWDDPRALEAAVGDRTAAVLIETIQGEGGIRPLPDEVVARARELCTERGAALVVDEIQTGMGRTGRWWGYEHHGITPDVVTLAKALGGGFPVGATWLSEAVQDALQPSDHSTTQGGGPLACAAVTTVLGVIERDRLVERAATLGTRLAEALRPLGEDVRGAGLLQALELGRPVAGQVVREALARGLIVNDVTPSAVRLAPPLVISEEELDDGVSRLSAAIEAVR